MLPTSSYYQKPPLTRCQQYHPWYIQDSSEQQCQHHSFFLVESSVLKFFMMETIVLLARRDLFLRNFRLENLNHLGSYVYIYIYIYIHKFFRKATCKGPFKVTQCNKNQQTSCEAQTFTSQKMEVDGFYMNIDGMKGMNLSPTNWDPNSKKFSSPHKTTWPFYGWSSYPS